MINIVDKKTRSRMMSGIKSNNTAPELLVRKELHIGATVISCMIPTFQVSQTWFFQSIKLLYMLMVVFSINTIAIYSSSLKAELNSGRSKYWQM